MSIENIFNISASAMTAQQLRLTSTASNLSNADVATNSADTAYKARYPVFSAVQSAVTDAMEQQTAGVQVDGMYESPAEIRKQYQPGHPRADQDGFVYYSNVNTVEEMTNLISASRSYEMNAQVLNTAKSLMLRTLQLGQS